MVLPAEEESPTIHQEVHLHESGSADFVAVGLRAHAAGYGEDMGNPVKKPKPATVEPPSSTCSVPSDAPRAHQSAPLTPSRITAEAMPQIELESASEAAKSEQSRDSVGTMGAGYEGEPQNRNRINSGRHGERIPCPMDAAHSIYALRLQAHLKKCTKTRDIAFSHCLPFMQPGVNLPLQQRHDREKQEERQQHQQQHAAFAKAKDAQPLLTQELEAKITRAYRQAVQYLNTPHPFEKVATDAETAEAAATAVDPWGATVHLPASEFISKCCSVTPKEREGRRDREAILLLRAAADACKVPLDSGVAAAEESSMAAFEAEVQEVLLLPRQDRLNALLELLKHFQKRLNKHQKQHFQLLALCLYNNYLEPGNCDKTLLVELGAGKGDLTRWFSCWSAVSVAPDSGTESVVAEAHANTHECNDNSALNPKYRGLRCIAVDREARRYCKEAKDKTFRNPNSTRPVHPAAIAAAERRLSAVDNDGTARPAERDRTAGSFLCADNSLKEATETVRCGELTRVVADDGSPAAAAAAAFPSAVGCTCCESYSNANECSVPAPLPVPPVRLRMDIADFSLVALIDYITGRGSLRVPHIPSFFKTLFSYGCRFLAPGKRLEEDPDEKKDKNAVKDKDSTENSTQDDDRLKVTIAQEARTKEFISASTRGPKPSFLCSIEDGSVHDFFTLSQTLGEGGGPDLQKIDETLREHFRDSGISTVVGVAKHLCGGGSDVALRCFASARDTTHSTLNFCVCIATCCHHRCTVDSFVGTDFLLKCGFTEDEVPLLFSLSGWATGAANRKREVGKMVKKILDISRVWWLRQKGFMTATLKQFVESGETPECFVIVANSHSGSST